MPVKPGPSQSVTCFGFVCLFVCCEWDSGCVRGLVLLPLALWCPGLLFILSYYFSSHTFSHFLSISPSLTHFHSISLFTQSVKNSSFAFLAVLISCLVYPCAQALIELGSISHFLYCDPSFLTSCPIEHHHYHLISSSALLPHCFLTSVMYHNILPQHSLLVLWYSFIISFSL